MEVPGENPHRSHKRWIPPEGVLTTAATSRPHITSRKALIYWQTNIIQRKTDLACCKIAKQVLCLRTWQTRVDINGFEVLHGLVSPCHRPSLSNPHPCSLLAPHLTNYPSAVRRCCVR